MNGRDEVEARENRGKTEKDDPEKGQRDICRCSYAVRRIKGPAGIWSAVPDKDRENYEHTTRHVEPPGRKVYPGECHVLRTNEYGQKKVAERGRDAWNDKQKYLYDTMNGKKRIVGPFSDKSPRRYEVDPHEHAKDHPNREKGENSRKVHQADPLVIGRKYPRQYPSVAAFFRIETFRNFHYMLLG